MLVGNWVLIAVGLLGIIGSYFMFSHAGFRGWTLRTGRARIWIRLLGEDRAHTVTRFVFAPITCLFGIVLTLAGALRGPIGG